MDMSRILRLGVFSLSLLLLNPGAAHGQAAPPALPGAAAVLPAAQFVDETTFAVADVNIAAVDLDACRNWLIALMKQGGLPANDQAELEKGSGEGVAHLKQWQSGFVKAGGTHMFIVISGAQ